LNDCAAGGEWTEVASRKKLKSKCEGLDTTQDNTKTAELADRLQQVIAVSVL